MISCSTSSNNCIITAVARWRFRRENTFAGSWPSTLLEGGVGVDVFVLSTFWNTHIFRDWLRSLLENYNHFYVFSIIRIYYYYYYFFLTSWIFIPLVTRFLVTPLLVTALLCLVTPAEVKWNGNWNTATMMYIIFLAVDYMIICPKTRRLKEQYPSTSTFWQLRTGCDNFSYITVNNKILVENMTYLLSIGSRNSSKIYCKEFRYCEKKLNLIYGIGYLEQLFLCREWQRK